MGDKFASPWVLFYKSGTTVSEVGAEYNYQNPICEALGLKELHLEGGHQSSTKMQSFKTFSPVMKSLVQIAIWNSLSFWLVLAMFINTLVYNGFISNNMTNDSTIRFVLIVIYALANFGHQFHTTRLLYSNFTFILWQSCWIFICRNFIFLDTLAYQVYIKRRNEIERSRYRNHLDDLNSTHRYTTFSLELFGVAERLNTYRLLIKDSDMLEHGEKGAWSIDDERRYSHLKVEERVDSEFDKFIKIWRDAEIKVYEKAIDSALEKILVNIGVLLGICLATVLAPWTPSPTNNSTAAQLGSYALLLSVSTGILALFSSMTSLTNATESAKNLLRLLEKNIEINPSKHEDKNVSKEVGFWEESFVSFFNGISGQSCLTPYDLWHIEMSQIKKILSFLLGPALTLIPPLKQKRSFLIDAPVRETYLSFTVHDTQVCYRDVGENSISSLSCSTPVEIPLMDSNSKGSEPTS